MPAWLLPAAVLGSAAIGGITSLLSGNKAADAAKDASEADLAFQKSVINRQLMQTAPYADVAYGALGDLATAYGQDLPMGFNPYAPLGREGAFINPATGGFNSTQLNQLFDLLNRSGTGSGSGSGNNRDEDDEREGRRNAARDALDRAGGLDAILDRLGPLGGLLGGFLNNATGGSGNSPNPTTPTPTPGTIPGNITTGAQLADYLMQYRNRVSSADRARFDQYIQQIRGIGNLTQQVNPNTPQGLEQRRADFITRFQNSPLYKMTYEPAIREATKAVERNSTAAGMLNSGRTLKALQDRAAEIGNRTYGSYEGGLWNMAGFGPQPTPASSGVSNAIQSGANAGYAQAAGIAGVGNAVNNALGSYAYLQGLRSNSQYAQGEP